MWNMRKETKLEAACCTALNLAAFKSFCKAFREYFRYSFCTFRICNASYPTLVSVWLTASLWCLSASDDSLSATNKSNDGWKANLPPGLRWLCTVIWVWVTCRVCAQTCLHVITRWQMCHGELWFWYHLTLNTLSFNIANQSLCKLDHALNVELFTEVLLHFTFFTFCHIGNVLSMYFTEYLQYVIANSIDSPK